MALCMLWHCAMTALSDLLPLRTLRKSRGESGVALAGILGVSHSVISRVERGRARATVGLLVAVADRYRLTDAELGRLLRWAAQAAPQASAAEAA